MDFQKSYNCQAVVDTDHQVILAARATNVPSDKQQEVAMAEEAIENTGEVPWELSADAGYYSPRTVEPVFGQIKRARLPAVPAAGTGKGRPGVTVDLHRP